VRTALFGAKKMELDPESALAEIATVARYYPTVAALALAALLDQAHHFRKHLSARSKGAPAGRGDAFDALVFGLVQAAQTAQPSLTIAAALAALRPSLTRRGGPLPGATIKALRERYGRGRKTMLKNSDAAAK